LLARLLVLRQAATYWGGPSQVHGAGVDGFKVCEIRTGGDTVTAAEARAMIVDARHETARSFNNPAVSERLQVPDGDVRLEELELDSLDLVEWGVEIEKRSGVVLDTADLASAGRLSDVVATLMAKQTADA